MQERMGKKPSYGKGMRLADNTQDSPVKSISTMTQDYDMGKMRYYSCGTKGYPSQAIQGNKMMKY